MNQILFQGVSLDELLLKIEQLMDAKIKHSPFHPPNQSNYITRQEAAELLRISLPTLADWTKQGWLTSYKIGNRVLYNPSEIEATLPKVLFQKFKKIKP